MVDINNVILIITIVMLIFIFITLYFAWRATTPLIPACPPCPTIDRNSLYSQDVDNLKEMVGYLTLIIKKYEAEKELYVLSNGYHQVYNSPKLEYLQKEIAKTIERVKANKNTESFFEKNLNNIIE